VRGTKQAGPQSCDSCGREFVVQKVRRRRGLRNDWTCPHCGFDNRAGVEFIKVAQAAAWHQRRRRRNG